jgi:hypothetical protein
MDPVLFKFKVIKPCTEDWGNMTTTATGKHCDLCSKNVIDFSVMSDEEVQYFFLNNTASEGCGRFRNEQLDRIRIQLPGNFFLKKIPAWQKYLVVLMICFGSNLYSLDITVGNNQGLHAQTPTVTMLNSDIKKPLVWKKKKKKGNKKHSTVIPIDLTITRMGMFIQVPDQRPPAEPIVCVVPKKSSIPETIPVKDETSEKKKSPPKKKPVPAIEFILPTALRTKRGRK